MTEYQCYWNRPAILTKEKLVKKLHVNPRKAADIRDGIEDERKRFETEEIDYVEDHETWQRYKDIMLFKNGSKAIDIYKTLHPTAKFRDAN